jgi:Ca2+-binding RTX toxin-like protein
MRVLLSATNPLELSSLDGTNGFNFNGAASYDYAGSAVSDAGDVNGDGFDDFVIGAHNADSNGSNSGASYVVFGQADWSGLASLDLSSLDGTNGFTIQGVAAGDGSGFAVSGAGDVNGDGFDDLLIGAPYADPNGSDTGASYVVFGKADWSGSASVNLSSLDGTNGFTLQGVATDDYAGSAVSGAGDVNGDGFDDLLIGAPDATTNGTYAGASYVVFGKADWSGSASVNLSSLDGTNGFTLNGAAAYDYSGRAVSGAGDVNGDGFDDLLIGAFATDTNGSNSGAAYVVFGKADWSGSASVNLSSLDGTDGFVLNGVAANDSAGRAVSGAGDVNGDGFDDLLIGAPSVDTNGGNSGASYVVFGQADWSGSASMNLSSLDGTNGFTFDGAAAYDGSGRDVSGAGDVNGDGFDDILVGAPYANPHGSSSGASYVVFGNGDWSGTADLSPSSLDGNNGFILNGNSAGDDAGFAVSGAGDINGDGFDDLLLGALEASPHGTYSGAGYVAFGANFTPATVAFDSLSGTLTVTDVGPGNAAITIRVNAGNVVVEINGVADTSFGTVAASNVTAIIVTGGGLSNNIDLTGVTGTDFPLLTSVQVDGGAGNDTVLGSGLADSVTGGDGHDSLDGEAGNDLLNGNAGNDTLLGGNDDDRLLGGAGHDSLDGGNGHDSLNGHGGNDTLSGGDGNDLALGMSGKDILYGGAGNDTLSGGDDRDRILGDAGNDSLDGGNGDDTLRGHNGDDTLIGDAGADYVDGGSNFDRHDFDTLDQVFRCEALYP